MTKYNELYEAFLKLVDENAADAARASECLVKISRVFAEYNMAATEAKKKAILKLAEISKTVDPATNKPITGTKAEALAEASEENFAYMDLKAHLENINVYLSAVKYFQMGLTNEYSNARNT